MSLLKGQKLVKKAKIEKLKCDISGYFQTMWHIFYPQNVQKFDNFKGKLLHLNTPILGILFRVEL